MPNGLCQCVYTYSITAWSMCITSSVRHNSSCNDMTCSSTSALQTLSLPVFKKHLKHVRSISRLMLNSKSINKPGRAVADISVPVDSNLVGGIELLFDRFDAKMHQNFLSKIKKKLSGSNSYCLVAYRLSIWRRKITHQFNELN